MKYCLGGAMIWSLDLDDFNYFCNKNTKYPLTAFISNKLSIGKNVTKCQELLHIFNDTG